MAAEPLGAPPSAIRWSGACTADLFALSELAGVAILDAQGAVAAATGRLAQRGALAADFCAQASGFFAPLYAAALAPPTLVPDEAGESKAASQPPRFPLPGELPVSQFPRDAATSLAACGAVFIPFSCTSVSVFATSRYRRQSLAVCRVPFGLLVALGELPTPPQRFFAAVDALCAKLRS